MDDKLNVSVAEVIVAVTIIFVATLLISYLVFATMRIQLTPAVKAISTTGGKL